MIDRRKVLVVGAGIAGLGAAHTLRKHGFDVTLFEAGPRAGGRVIGEEVDGFRIDLGANIFVETYGTVRRLADELNIPMKRTPVPINGGVYHDGKFHAFYGGDQLKNRLKTARGFLAFRLLSPGGVRQALRFVRMLRRRGHDLSLDDHTRMLDLDTGESIAEFVERNFGSELLERFLQPNLTSYTFGSPEELGVPYSLAASWNFGLNGVTWPFMPENGPSGFVEVLAQACHEDTRFSTPVKRVVVENGTVRGVVTDEGFVEADAVVCATTATTALKIVPGLPHSIENALRTVTYSKCYRVFFGLDSNPFPKDWYAVAFPRRTGALMSGMTNSTVLTPDCAPRGKALIDALVGGKQAEELSTLSDDEGGRRVLAEIRKFFPNMPERPLFTRVQRWDEAVCLASPGMMTALDRMRRGDLASVRGLYFAGEYMGVPSVNGALRSGIGAADECAAFFSRPLAPPVRPGGISRPSSGSTSRRPPGPRGRRLGNLRDRFRDFPGFMDRLNREYGDVVSYEIPRKTCCLVFDIDLIRDVLVKRASLFPKPTLYDVGHKQLITTPTVFLSTGDDHRRRRKLIASAFEPAHMAAYAEVAVENALSLHSRWIPGEVFDADQEIRRLVRRMAFGIFFGRARQVDEQLGDDAVSAFKWDIVLGLLPFSSLLRALPLPGNRRARRVCEALDAIVFDAIRRAREPGHDGVDLTSRLVYARDETGRDPPFSDEEIRNELYTLMLVNFFDPMISALTWAIDYIVRHPDVRDRLEGEVDAVLGDRPLTVADGDRLTYVRAVFLESGRLTPPTHYVDREAAEDCELGGFLIRKGTLVQSCFRVHESHEKYCPEADAFRPERWLDGNRPSVCPDHPPTLFGEGLYSCLGPQLATMACTYVLAGIIQHWRLGPMGTEPPQVDGSLLYMVKGGLPVVAKARKR